MNEETVTGLRAATEKQEHTSDHTLTFQSNKMSPKIHLNKHRLGTAWTVRDKISRKVTDSSFALNRTTVCVGTKQNLHTLVVSASWGLGCWQSLGASGWRSDPEFSCWPTALRGPAGFLRLPPGKGRAQTLRNHWLLWVSLVRSSCQIVHL